MSDEANDRSFIYMVFMGGNPVRAYEKEEDASAEASDRGGYANGVTVWQMTVWKSR